MKLTLLIFISLAELASSQTITIKNTPDSLFMVTNYIYPQIDRRIFFDYPTFQNSNSEMGYVYAITNGANASIIPLAGNGAYKYFKLTTGSNPGQTAVKLSLKEPSTSTDSEPVIFNITVMPRMIDTLVSNLYKSFYAKGLHADKWQLFSLPVNDLQLTPKVVFSKLNNDFKLYSLSSDGKTKDVTNQDTLFKNLGSGYWLKTKATTERWKVKLPFSSARRTDALLRFYVKKGWKLIGSPYDYPVYWRTFLFQNGEQVANDVARIWSFNPETQTWREISKLEYIYPWAAYAVYTAEDEIAIDFYHNYGINYYSTLPKNQAKIASRELGTGKLRINNADLAFGFKSDAKDGIDIKDDPLLPSSPDSKISPAYWSRDSRALTADYRSETSFFENKNLNTWDLLIPAGNHTLKLAELNGFDGSTKVLLSGANYYQFLNLDEEISISLSNDTKFTLSIGEREKLSQTVLPPQPILHRAFPNPFNPTTTFSFSLPKLSHVSISVFDNSGKLVATLLNETKMAGYHEIHFNATNLASGIYLYKLDVENNKPLFGKITLIK